MRHSTIQITMLIVCLMLGSFQYGMVQVDNLQKNTQTSAAAKAVYQEDL